MRKLNREELYELVWSRPVSAVAREWGVSGVALARACRRRGIPVPGRGYWARVRAGLPYKRPPLPTAPPSSPLVYTHTPARTPKNRDSLHQEAILIDPAVTAQLDYEAANPILIPPTLRGCHRLVRATRDALERHGRAHGENLLSSRVTRGVVPRALRIWQALLAAAEARRFTVEADAAKTRFVVIGEGIAVNLSERMTRRRVTEDRWGARYEYDGSGQLTLRIDGYYQEGFRCSWSDGTRQRVEDCLGDFMVHLVRAALAEKQRRAEREERERDWQAERARAAMRARELAREQQRADDAKALIADWQQAELLRALVTHLTTLFPKHEGLAVWAAWCQRYADALDPAGRIEEVVARFAEPPGGPEGLQVAR